MKFCGIHVPFIIFLTTSVVTTLAKRKRTTKDWNKVDYNDVEKNWEEGDDPTELEHEYERIQKLQEMKAKEGPKIDWNNKDEVKKLMNTPGGFGGGMGGTMVFVHIKQSHLEGLAYPRPAMDKLSGKWTALLRTASLQASVYVIEDSQLLVSVDKSWMRKDVMTFVLQQPEVEKLVLDNKEYFPENLPKDDEEEL
mmetsp:Transcript_2458/g.2583  ORF Transcript_2458/g.2583 Transcript_2458/m.2583 type:complete len:195 (-) Transcript_2458:259-843(-)|eukprot:CAMPEP_0182419342 /NCGR_PEP_ID=MMETSP1167-20130531/3791_1 /TAXON_ID=2988 /ORGANISM="Mallomonas Sp, Strain CCMP3275" /LENGTH=194 /DNA_ID=CAMNT_0024594189 /DNA_START=157 /DNA_END=741 /DNA_ORIENTATION=+